MSDAFDMKDEWLTLKRLTKVFRDSKRVRTVAVRDFSLTLKAHEILAIVGESGCGKSTVSRILMGLEQPDEGEIHLFGALSDAADSTALAKRRQAMQMIFQDPYSSLDPMLTMAQILEEPMRLLRREWNGEERARKIRELMAWIGLDLSHLKQRAKQLSGGQRQRIGIARALACEPRILICDEPVSALDVSIQAQILNLLKRAKEEFGIAMIFISHDLGVVRYVADRICVMLKGRICEIGDADRIFETPKHPYTKYLMESVPTLRMTEKKQVEAEMKEERVEVSEEGCPFYALCSRADELCGARFPMSSGTEAHQWFCFHELDEKIRC